MSLSWSDTSLKLMWLLYLLGSGSTAREELPGPTYTLRDPGNLTSLGGLPMSKFAPQCPPRSARLLSSSAPSMGRLRERYAFASSGHCVNPERRCKRDHRASAYVTGSRRGLVGRDCCHRRGGRSPRRRAAAGAVAPLARVKKLADGICRFPPATPSGCRPDCA